MHQTELDILLSQRGDMQVTDITAYVWPFIDVITDKPYEEIIQMPIYQKIRKNALDGCLQVHDCVLEGPCYTRTRRITEPYLVYYFDNIMDLISWIYVRGPSEHRQTLRKIYDTLEVDHTLNKITDHLQQMTTSSYPSATS